MSTTINGQNYFNEKSFNEACEALEHGEAVTINVDCIGHTRNNNEQEVYREELEKKYGSRLSVDKNDGAYSYSYTYKLQ